MTQDQAKNSQMLTLGDLCNERDLNGYTRRQIDYAIREFRISAVGRAGIIRLFARDQIPLIKAALRRTTRHQ